MLAALGIGKVLIENGSAHEAETVLRDARSLAMRLYGSGDHPNAMMISDYLATSLKMQGQLGAAADMYRASYANYTRRYGPDDDGTLIAANNLAHTLKLQGNLDDAITIFRATLASRKRNFGAENAITLSCARNLARTLCSRADYRDEAYAIYAEYLPIARRVLGQEHPETIMLTINHAVQDSVHKPGGRAEAEATLVKMLAVQQRVLGMHHPDTFYTAARLQDVRHGRS